MSEEEKFWFYQLTDEEIETLGKSLTWQEITKQYPRPPWCPHLQVFDETLGCQLLLKRQVHTENDCKDCLRYQGDTLGKALGELAQAITDFSRACKEAPVDQTTE